MYYGTAMLALRRLRCPLIMSDVNTLILWNSSVLAYRIFVCGSVYFACNDSIQQMYRLELFVICIKDSHGLYNLDICIRYMQNIYLPSETDQCRTQNF